MAAKVTNGKVSKFIRLDKLVADRIAKLAEADNRSWSGMAALILDRGSALLERRKKGDSR